MSRGLKIIIGLCGVGATVLITALAFDSQEEQHAECVTSCRQRGWEGRSPGGKRMTCAEQCGLRNAHAERDRARPEQTDDDCEFPKLCSTSVTWPIVESTRVVSPVDTEARRPLQPLQNEIWQREQKETARNAIPRAFMDKPVLARLLAQVPAESRTRKEIFLELREVQFANLPIETDERNQVVRECGGDTEHYIGITYCLADAAQALEEFRAAARANAPPTAVEPNELRAMLRSSDDVNVGVPALALRYYDAARDMVRFGDVDAAVRYLKDAFDFAGLPTIVTYQRACGIAPTASLIGDEMTRCLRATVEHMRSTQGCMGLTGPVACDSITDPQWSGSPGGIPGEIIWDGMQYHWTTPRSDPPQPGIVRDGN